MNLKYRPDSDMARFTTLAAFERECACGLFVRTNGSRGPMDERAKYLIYSTNLGWLGFLILINLLAEARCRLDDKMDREC